LKYIGGGGWKRLSPDAAESEWGHKWAISAFRPLKRKSKSPKKDKKTISRSQSPHAVDDNWDTQSMMNGGNRSMFENLNTSHHGALETDDNHLKRCPACRWKALKR